jgi:hypothetical protein
MSGTHTVIGHFDCGCGQAAQPESLELVVCHTKQEVDSVVERMKQHSAAHQCRPEPAMAIIVLPGEPEIVHAQIIDPEAYLLFPDAQSYVARHNERKEYDASLGRKARPRPPTSRSLNDH